MRPVPAKVHQPLATVKKQQKVAKRPKKINRRAGHNSEPFIWPKKLMMSVRLLLAQSGFEIKLGGPMCLPRL